MDIPTDYLKKKTERATGKPKHRTYLAELVSPFLKHFRYDNASLERDLQAFWSLIYRKRNEGRIVPLLQWASGKDLHIKQVIKALHKLK